MLLVVLLQTKHGKGFAVETCNILCREIIVEQGHMSVFYVMNNVKYSPTCPGAKVGYGNFAPAPINMVDIGRK
jgi:hypothetical protein